MFALINVGERSGTGLCDIYYIWEENGFEKPKLSENVDPDRITFTLEIEFDGVNDGVFDDLKKTENDLYAQIKNDQIIA